MNSYPFYHYRVISSYLCISCGNKIPFSDNHGYCTKLDEYFCSICCDYYIEDEEYFNNRFGFKIKIELIESIHEENHVYKNNKK